MSYSDKYSYLIDAKAKSMVSSNKKSIINFITKQNAIIERMVVRRDTNIKRKIKQLDIHCEEDFYIEMFQYNKENYDIAIQSYDNEKELRMKLQSDILVIRGMLLDEISKNNKLQKKIDSI
jgi:hypothetical protein